MAEQEIFILAEHALKAVIDQIKDDQWSMIMPKEFQAWGKKADVSLREVINAHAYDDAWVPDTLSGQTIAEVGKKYNGDLLGQDPKASYATITETAEEAVKGLTDLDRIVHLTYGDFPAREYLKHITYYRGLRTYDLAKVIGVDPKLPEALVQGLWDMIAPEAEQWRQMGVFGAKVDVPDDADLQTKLLGLTGRRA
jgi:uncharacterized protein (TIGR03086 family)